MATKLSSSKKIRSYWDSRAQDYGSGMCAGSNDPHLKTLELKCLHKILPRRGTILEIGCGNGYNLVRLQRPHAQLWGIDFSRDMIREARRYNPGHIRYQVGDVLHLGLTEASDCIFTDRCLINLPSDRLQIQALRQIHRALKPGGLFVLMEQSAEQLHRVNYVRKILRVSPIEEPPFNHYLRWKNLQAPLHRLFAVEKTLNPSSTYYFSSRILNALIHRDKARYEDMINVISSKLPQVGNWGTLIVTLARKIS